MVMVDNKKLFVLLSIFVLAIFLVGTVSAVKDTSVKWDNKKDFEKKGNQKYGKYQIYDSLFLGVGKGNKLMDIELKENTETCTQNCFAIGDITLYEAGSLADAVIFKTLQKDGSWLEQPIRSYQFYIKQPVIETVIQDYKIVCSSYVSHTDEFGEYLEGQNCSNVPNGNHIQKSPEWIPYVLGDVVPAGTYILKLEGEKRPTRTVDWVVQSQGIWTNDWATWGNISLGDNAEVRLLTPANNSIDFDGIVLFNATGNITVSGSYMNNMSLWTNESGTWNLKNTTNPNAFYSSVSAVLNSNGNNAVMFGVRISFSKPVKINQIKKASLSLGNSMRILNASTNALIQASDGQSGDWFNFTPPVILQPNTNYSIILYGSNTQYYRTSAGFTPFTSNDATWWCGTWSSNPALCDDDYVRNVQEINYTILYNYTASDFTRAYGNSQNIKWNVQACDTDNVCGFAPSNYTFFTDTLPPVTNLTSPSGKYGFGKVGNLLQLNWSIYELGGSPAYCWYEYNNVNTSVNCTANTTTFAIASPNAKSLKFWSNDTLGNTGYTETNWSYYVFENSANYNAQALETSSQTFSTNITLDNTSIASAYFVYNNTLYSASLVLDGSDRAILSRTITVPEISVSTNYSFFWEINLNSPQVNTTLQNQTVVAFTVDNCSVNSILVINNTLVDEETQNKITGNSTIEVEVILRNADGVNMGTLSKIYYNTSYAPVCVNALYNTTIYVDIVESYIADNYVQEFWYLNNGLLNESNWNLDNFTTKNVTLRALKLDDSETFLFKYYNANFLITQGAIIRVLRNYIGEGVFKEAERCKLDANGECHLHLVGEDVIYQFQVIIDGKEDFLSGNFNAKCVNTPCSITLQKGTSTNDWDIQHDNLAEGTYTLNTDKDNRTVSLAFNLAQTGEMQLDVFTYTNDPNTQDTLVATNSVVAKSGTTEVTIPLTYENTTYYAVVRHNNVFVTTQWVDLNEDGFKYFGALGLFLGALIVLTLGLIAVSSGGWTIVFIILGLIVASVTKLVNMDYYLLMFVICAGGLIIWRLASRRSL